MTWWSVAAGLLAQGHPSVLVTLCTVKGSAPREPGAKMLVWTDGQHGTVGGGTLEFTIVEQARRMLAAGALWSFQNYPLGPLLGQCCGGNVGVALERLDSAAWLEEIAAAEAGGAPYAIISRLDAEAVARRIARPADGGGISVQFAAGAQPVSRRIGEGAIITEHVVPRPHLLLFGAGHVGQALAPIAASLPFQLHWFDTRADFARPGLTVTNDPVARVKAAPPGAFALIFTHSHALDYDLVHAVLARGSFVYCGLIGSATKRARFEKRLLADGIERALLAHLTCPIGAIGLTSKLPQVMAVAVAAELLLVLEAGQRNARSIRTRHAS